MVHTTTSHHRIHWVSAARITLVDAQYTVIFILFVLKKALSGANYIA